MTTLEPLPAAKALESYFLEARCKLLDVAAILDRITRGGQVHDDSRLVQIRRALEVLPGQEGAKAERIQQIFSLEYDAGWKKPTPR